MLPIDFEIQELIRKKADNGMAVAELEYLGLSLRVINTLEEKMGVIFIQQLIEKSEKELLAIKQLGQGAVKQILNALERFPELENERERWHKGSERTEYYKHRIDVRSVRAILS